MSFKPPETLLEIACDSGIKKTEQSAAATFGLTLLAGAYIALGGLLALRCSAGLSFSMYEPLVKTVFAMVFPLGLILVIVCGADLFTGNCLSLGVAYYDKKILFNKALQSWAYSWLGNFLGSILVAYFLAYSSGLFFDVVKVGTREIMPWANAAVGMANSKCALSFQYAFLRGVGCNWLVCIAIYAASAADDIVGKIIAIWFPTFAFVAMGMEHCVANMFFVPLGIFIGKSSFYTISTEYLSLSATWQSFVVNNLLPVTIGNVVGGAVFVAGMYSLIYMKKR